jgi:hypothetical protein
MSTQIQRRRGTTAEHSTFTGVEGELTVDTTKDTAVVHDGTTVGGHPLQKQYPPLGSAAAPTYTFTGDPNTGIYSPGADQVAVATNGTQRITIDSSGRLLVGTSTARSNFFNTASSAPQQLQVEGTTGNTCSLSSICSVADTSGGRLLLAHQRSGAVGGNTILNSGDQAGYITFQGNDGGQFVECASIEAQVDGTPGANDMPGRLVFSTTADGGSSPSERLRITSAGLVGIGTSSPGEQLDVSSGTGGVIRVTSSDGSISAAGERIGKIEMYSSDGSSNGTGIAAYIEAVSQAAFTGQGRPTHLTFGTYNSGGSLGERVRITDAGNVGIGITSPAKKLDVYEGSTGNVEQYLRNTTINLLSKIDGTTSAQFGTETSHPLALLTANTERARIDNSGRLLVGTSSAINSNYGGTGGLLQVAKNGYLPIGFYAYSDIAGESGYCPYVELHRATGTQASPTVVGSGDDLGLINFYGHDGSTFMRSALIKAVVDGTPGAGDMPGRLVFSTTADGAYIPTERMRIDNLGRIFTYNANTGNNSLTVASAAAAGTAVANFIGTHGATGVNTGTSSFIVWTNGNVQNTNNSYTAISDIKLKENIVDANSQWDDIKALQVRNYNLKEGQTHRQIGLIAQEVEPVSPGLVYESPDRDEDGNDLGTVTKSVNYSVLYMKAVKALQEAIAKIETLEGMVAVNNITIDEQQHQLSTLAARLTALESA